MVAKGSRKKFYMRYGLLTTVCIYYTDFVQTSSKPVVKDGQMVISKKKFPLKHAELFTVTFGYHYDIKSFGDLFKRNNFIEVNHIHIDPYKRTIWDLPTLVDNFPYQKVNF